MAALVKRKSTAEAVKEVKQSTKKDYKKTNDKIDPNRLIPTGSTILNLACADNYEGGYGAGKIVNVVGDSSAGKSILALSVFAEMHMSKRFDNYRFIYDDVEAASEFNMVRLFNREIADRITEGSEYKSNPICSDTIDEAYGHIQRALDDDQPFIYVLDSLDSLTSKEEKERAKQIAKDKDAAGSYKTQRVRMLTEMLRQTRKQIKETDSLLIIVSQVRDDLSPSLFGATKTRAGGHALRHHSTHEVWLKVIKRVKRTVNGKQYTIGNEVEFTVTKNKMTGKQFLKGTFFTFRDYGVDDIRSCISFLLDHNIWSKTGGKINCGDWNFKGSLDEVINQVELNGLQPKLKKLAGKSWLEIQKKLELNRKPKYG